MELRRDPESGIETIRAHFDGHAYEPHDHDDVLVGVTEQGLQQFRCRRAVHTSTPGRAILIEPGEVHDGRSAGAEGFTYAMLYLPYARVARASATARGAAAASVSGRRSTTTRRSARRSARRSSRCTAARGGSRATSPWSGCTRSCSATWRRRLLATGAAPGQVAAEVGFADQSHLGRWFRRAYGLTPAAYARICTDVPDPAPSALQLGRGRSPVFDTKVALIIRADLATWQKLNVAAFLATGVAAQAPEALGDPYLDAAGGAYGRMLGQPILVFAAPDAAALQVAQRRARERELRMVAYVSAMFSTGHDAANRQAFAAEDPGRMDLVGLAVRGGRKAVDKVTQGLALHP